jgi:GntR family carbon starvation induced transcriptional regulator
MTEPKSDSTQTMATAIAAKLRDMIAKGEILPGERLRLNDLRATFGVSLSPLREALSRLVGEAEGFVEMEDQRSYRVAPVSAANLIEVTKMRAELECLALRETIARADDDWEAQVVATLYRLNKMPSSPETPEQMQAWESVHRALHQSLIGGCGMPLLLQFCASLHDLNDRYRRLFFAKHPVDRDVAQEHQEVCRAAVERRADDACALLRRHIERTGTNVLAVLQAGQKQRSIG